MQLTHVLGVYGGPEFVVTYQNGDQVGYVMTVFASKIIEAHDAPQDTEALHMKCVTPDELAALPLAAWAEVVLPSLFRYQGQPLYQPVTWTPPER